MIYKRLLWCCVISSYFTMVCAQQDGKDDANAEQQKETQNITIGVLKITDIGDGLTSVKQLDEFMKNPEVKGILVLFNSGGGGAGASWHVFEEFKKARQEKPLVSYVYGDCASGAYLIASATHFIGVSPGATVGSVGVRWSYRKLWNQKIINTKGGLSADVEDVVIARGKYKVVPRDDKLMSCEEQNLIGSLLDGLYQKFVEDVAEMRNLSLDNQGRWAEGQVFCARQAQELKLIDSLGPLSLVYDVFRGLLAKRGTSLAGLAGDFVLLYPKQEEDEAHKECSCSSAMDRPSIELHI